MFKKCSCCDEEWSHCESFFSDKGLKFAGYQAGFRSPDAGLFLFNHLKENCNTTLALKVGVVRDELMPKATFETFEPHSKGCPGHCADQDNLQPCANSSCNGQIIRTLIQEVKKRVA